MSSATERDPVQVQLPVGEVRPGAGDGLTGPQVTAAQRQEAGDEVRRQVLSDEHVDRAEGRTTPFTTDFEDLVARYVWGEIWTRPGLDRRTRSVVAITALVARGEHDELDVYVRGARRAGLSFEEIKEVLLQAAVYCGAGAAGRAFSIAQRCLEEETTRGRAVAGEAAPAVDDEEERWTSA